MRGGPSVQESIDLITSEVVDTYAADGVVCIKNALHAEWLDLLGMGLARVMADPSQAKHLFYDGQPNEFIETLRNFDAAFEIRRLVFDSPIADMISKLIDSDDIWYYSDEFFVKDGANCGRTPWHQDMPYWPLEGNKIASAWICLDSIPKDECLEYIPGSHKGVRYDGFNPRIVAEDPTAPHYGKDLPPLPDIEADRDAWNIASWDIEPGDVIFAHPGVLHGGGQTGPNSRRRAITIRLYGDDITYALRPDTKPTAPYTPGLGLRLEPGDLLRHPWYPQIRPVPTSERIGTSTER